MPVEFDADALTSVATVSIFKSNFVIAAQLAERYSYYAETETEKS